MYAPGDAGDFGVIPAGRGGRQIDGFCGIPHTLPVKFLMGMTWRPSVFGVHLGVEEWR